ERFLSATQRDARERARYIIGGTGGADAEARTTSFQPPPDPQADAAATANGPRAGARDADPLTTGGIAPAERRSEGEGPPRRAGEEAPEEDLWEPLGIRTGRFVWTPSVDILAGVTDNTARGRNGEAGLAMRIAPEITVRSDFARHEVTASLRGAIDGYGDDNIDLVPDLDATANVRFDLYDPTTLTLGASWSWRQETASDANVPNTVSTPGDEHAVGLTATLTHLFRSVEATITTAVTRYFYTESTLVGGGSLSNDDRERTEGTVGLRLAYADPVLLRPFIDGEVGLRRYDVSADTGGYRRGAETFALRGGFIVDDPVLTGELSAGIAGERADDTRLGDILTWTVDGSLTWRATALTTVTASATTSINATTLAGSGGSIAHTLGLSVRHALRRNLDANLDLTATRTDYDGTGRTDDLFLAAAGLTYRMNRTLALRGLVEHERLYTTATGEGYDATTVLAGVRLTR
ncbi:MAG: outer membrane beta-barrel protein, partial [Hyphomicrobiaceae bacterium]|nr:outer membrane beta-barrel protein [Hyphomicrobiaceae bacterium]